MKALALVLVALPAAAQERETALYGPLLTQCYEAAADWDSREECIGRLSQACMSGEEDGESTHGMARCIRAETEAWDRLLNAEYRATMDWAKEADADEREYSPEYANRAETLRDAQRAWIAFRDAQCAFDYAQWGSGSMRLIVGAACFMEMTAQRTLELGRMRDLMQ